MQLYVTRTTKNQTRRRSESAYVRQVNFFLQLLHRAGEGDSAPLKPSLYLEPYNGPQRHWDHDFDLRRSRDVIDDIII